jgi:hypothetical protein
MKTLILAGVAIAAAAAAAPQPEGVFLNVRDGARVRVHDEATVYFVDRGILRHLTYLAYRNLYPNDWRGITELVDAPPHLVGRGLNEKTRLVKVGKTVWFIDNGETKRHVSSVDAFDACGFSWHRVKAVTARDIADLPEGPPLR